MAMTNAEKSLEYTYLILYVFVCIYFAIIKKSIKITNKYKTNYLLGQTTRQPLSNSEP